jgi:hypothetical protein
VSKTPNTATRPRWDNGNAEYGEIGASVFSLLFKMLILSFGKASILDVIMKSSKHILLLFIALINPCPDFDKKVSLQR